MSIVTVIEWGENVKKKNLGISELQIFEKLK